MKGFRVLAAVCFGAVAALVCVAVATAATGVKTAKPPYLVPTAPGVVVDPILSTSDIVPENQNPSVPDVRDPGRARGV